MGEKHSVQGNSINSVYIKWLKVSIIGCVNTLLDIAIFSRIHYARLSLVAAATDTASAAMLHAKSFQTN